jgi:uncharacterized protein
MSPEFTWDPYKAASNLSKHGVGFETATRAFADPHAIFELERHVDGEERWQTIGLVDGQLLLLVVHANWTEDGLEIIRLISARQAERHERKRYEEQFGPL